MYHHQACTNACMYTRYCFFFFKWTFTLIIMGTFNPFATNRIELASQINIYEDNCTHVTSASSDLVMMYISASL